MFPHEDQDSDCLIIYEAGRDDGLPVGNGEDRIHLMKSEENNRTEEKTGEWSLTIIFITAILSDFGFVEKGMFIFISFGLQVLGKAWQDLNSTKKHGCQCMETNVEMDASAFKWHMLGIVRIV